MKVFTLYSDDSLSQVYESTKVSRRGKIFEDIEKQKYTIAFSVGLGHESVLEHTNLIMGFLLDKSDINQELNDVLETCHYLHYRLYDNPEYKNKVLIIAGSIRGYKHIFRNIKNMNNKYLEAIKQELYENSYSDFFKDFIKDNIMDENKFNKFIGKKYPVVTLPNGEAVAVKNARRKIDEFYIKDRVAVLWYDNVTEIQDNILAATGLVIPFVDLLEFCTIGVKIWSSRTASHQIVRHRNGVTQESQRYCNYAEDIRSSKTMEELLEKMFVDPCMEDLIAKFGGPLKFKTVDKESEEYKAAYKQYIDNDAHRAILNAAKTAFDSYLYINDKNLLKAEDIRAILPNNCKTSLIMTFTYRNLIKAIELRVDKAAQSEIRNIFICLETILKERILNTDEDLNAYICPCKKNNYYADIESMINPIVSEDEISEPVDSTKVEVLTKTETEELKKDLSNEYGIDIESVMKSAPKDVFREDK